MAAASALWCRLRRDHRSVNHLPDPTHLTGTDEQLLRALIKLLRAESRTRSPLAVVAILGTLTLGKSSSPWPAAHVSTRSSSCFRSGSEASDGPREFACLMWATSSSATLAALLALLPPLALERRELAEQGVE